MIKNIFTQITEKFSYFLITVILVLGLSISVQSLLAVWTAPSNSPPSNNISAPLTEGSNAQEKAGTLGIASDFYVDINTLYVDSANSRVGIGTDNPSHQFHIYDSINNAEIDIQTGGSPGDNSHWAIYHNNLDNSLRFWQGDNRLTILPNGNVGIGTISPQATLEVSGTIKASAPVDNNDVATKAYVDAQSSSNSRFVGYTSGTYQGAFVYHLYSGAMAAEKICDNEYPGSHWCRLAEVIDNPEDINGRWAWIRDAVDWGSCKCWGSISTYYRFHCFYKGGSSSDYVFESTTMCSSVSELFTKRECERWKINIFSPSYQGVIIRGRELRSTYCNQSYPLPCCK